MVLIAYFLLEHQTIGSHSYAYLLLNMAGSILIIISLLWDWNLGAFINNLIWIGITIYGFIKAKKEQKVD